jgi:hypothetical protein
MLFVMPRMKEAALVLGVFNEKNSENWNGTIGINI